MSENISIIDKLIQLSKIFKKGFTIEIQDNNIQQYNSNKHKYFPYVVSYQTIITIDYNKLEPRIKYFKIKYLDKQLRFSFISGWFDKDNNIYYIEFNRLFSSLNHAIAEAKKYKQKYVYDLNEGKEIKVVQ